MDELAEKAGMSNANVSAIENQKQGYSAESLEKLAHALDIDKGILLTVDPGAVGSIWPLWTAATPAQRAQLTEIAKTLIKPR